MIVAPGVVCVATAMIINACIIMLFVASPTGSTSARLDLTTMSYLIIVTLQITLKKTSEVD